MAKKCRLYSVTYRFPFSPDTMWEQECVFGKSKADIRNEAFHKSFEVLEVRYLGWEELPNEEK